MTRRFWVVRAPKLDPLHDFKTAMRQEADRLGCTPSQVFQAQYAANVAKRGIPLIEAYLRGEAP